MTQHQISPSAWRWGVERLRGPSEWRYSLFQTRPEAEPLYSRAALDAAVAAERERCAAICEQQRIGIDAFGGIDYHVELTRNQCAAAIRGARNG